MAGWPFQGSFGAEEHVTFVGDAYVDVQTGQLASLPAWGEDRTTDRIRVLAGGSCANTARHFASLVAQNGGSGKTRLCAALGDDTLGTFFRRELDGEALVDATYLHSVKDTPQATCLVLSGPADRAFVSCNTSNSRLGLEDAPWAEGLGPQGRKHLHVGGYFCCDGLQTQALERLCRNADSVSLDPQFDATGRWVGADGHLHAVLPHLAVLFCNESEACGIANKCDTVDEAMQRLTALAPSTLVVIKRGEHGASAGLGPQQRWDCPAPLLPAGTSLVDTCGAGDAFNAGFLFSYLFVHPGQVEEALLCGTRCGTHNVQHMGACAVKVPTNVACQ